MKKQIARLSPHQNGKVLGTLLGLSTAVFIIPVVVIASFATRGAVDQHGDPVNFPVFLFIFVPVVYAVFGYLGGAFWCFVYNVLFKYIGGIEFEAVETSNDP
jgi:ABC-type Na+ efflux pump permease subunit